MGTNYYVFDERITEETNVDSGLHIGKNSAGWGFNFEAHKGLRTVKAYKKFLKGKVIYNEYDDEIPYDEFWDIVKDSKEKDYYGRRPYSYSNPDPNSSSCRNYYTEWEDEGYMFTSVEFC